MNNMLEYKGYHARIEFDSEDMIFVGTVFGINDSLSFHGSSVEELQNKFSTCIDNYLLMCSEIGKEPEKGAEFQSRRPTGRVRLTKGTLFMGRPPRAPINRFNL